MRLNFIMYIQHMTCLFHLYTIDKGLEITMSIASSGVTFPESCDEFIITPELIHQFFAAITSGDIHTVELILQTTDAHHLTQDLLEAENDEDGRYPLHTAAAFGQLAIAEMLIDHGAKQVPDVEDGEYPLHEAVSSDSYDIMRLLIDKGADVNAQNYSGDTALHWAVSGGDIDMIKILIHAGADPFISTEGSDPPIWSTTNTNIIHAMGYKTCGCRSCTLGQECEHDLYVVPV